MQESVTLSDTYTYPTHSIMSIAAFVHTQSLSVTEYKLSLAAAGKDQRKLTLSQQAL